MDNKSEPEQTKKEPGSVVGATMAVGLSLGVALGAAMDPDDLGVYITMGMVFGLLFGWSIDMSNRENRKTDASNTPAVEIMDGKSNTSTTKGQTCS